MFNRKRALTAIGLAFSIAFHPHISSAEDVFTGTDFLKWDRQGQEFYIRTNAAMAILIALQNDRKHGQCLRDWLGNDEKAAYDGVIEAMNKFPSYHPRATLVAFMEKRCGSFTYR